jgi:hypothetical protein
MVLGNRNDLFKVELPKIFIPDDIKAKYKNYILRLPSNIKDITDLINYTIQSITVPNFNYDPVEQVQSGYADVKRGTSRLYRNALSEEMLLERKFTITFSLLDGDINYWILLDTFFAYYNFENTTDKFIPDISIKLYNAEGLHMYTVKFTGCLLTSVGEYTLSYSEITPEFKTFDVGFSFNAMEMDFAK